MTSKGSGGRRYLPYVFTEQGIAMLSAVLKSDTAVSVSIRIMDGFVEMRRFLAGNAAMFERISAVELKQLEYQRGNDEKFNRIFGYIEDHSESSQKIFFEGQVYDAFSKLVELVREAKHEIVLVDGYTDVGTLNILAKKNAGVKVTIYTFRRNSLTAADVERFNAQYPNLDIRYMKSFHDRFLILDSKTVYHIGASLKDAGKKCFAISLIQDDAAAPAIMGRLGNKSG